MKRNRHEFFTPRKTTSWKQRKNMRKSANQSRFETCPLCQKSLPLHLIEVHAANCLRKGNDKYFHLPMVRMQNQNNEYISNKISESDGENLKLEEGKKPTDKGDAKLQWKNIISSGRNRDDIRPETESNQVPGLFVYEEFISKEEEEEIIRELDGKDIAVQHIQSRSGKTFVPWKQSRFNGKHHGKRWGVHCSLKDRKVYP